MIIRIPNRLFCILLCLGLFPVAADHHKKPAPRGLGIGAAITPGDVASPAPAAAAAAEAPIPEPEPAPRGQLAFKGDDARTTGAVSLWEFKAERWGMYTAHVISNTEKKTPAQVFLGESTAEINLPAGTYRSTPARRLYLAGQGKQELKVISAADIEAVILTPAPEGKPIVQADDKTIALHARDALTHSVKMRYEPKETKNCLGFWVNPDDWAEWTFTVTKPGTFELHVTQGCGSGNGGSKINVEVADQTQTFTVVDTGGWQTWKTLPVGEITFEKAGTYTLAIKPQTKANKAVMDIHRIDLKPAKIEK